MKFVHVPHTALSDDAIRKLAEHTVMAVADSNEHVVRATGHIVRRMCPHTVLKFSRFLAHSASEFAIDDVFNVLEHVIGELNRESARA